MMAIGQIVICPGCREVAWNAIIKRRAREAGEGSARYLDELYDEMFPSGRNSLDEKGGDADGN
jgi:hypothetical protein